MLQTLFHIPNDIYFGLPIFGFGWLLLFWSIGSVVLLMWLARRQGSNAETWGYVPLLLLVGAAIWFLLPKLCVPPRGLPIRGYGVMLLVAVAAGVGLAAWRARRLGVDPELIFAMAFWMFIPGIVGARMFYVIEYWSDFQKDTFGQTLVAMINVTQGGLVVYGSLIGGILGLLGFIARYKMPPLATFDLIAPTLALGMGIGRLGCLLNGCCYGDLCDSPWAITFPAGSPPHVRQVQRGQTFLHGLKVVGDRYDRPVITEVRPGSPAHKHRLKPDQQIDSINGRAIHSIEEAQMVLLNAHKGQARISITTLGAPSTHQWPLEGPAPRSLPVHPTQLYASLNGLLLCLFLLAYAPFCRRDGELWAMTLTLYPITRFLLEMIRADEPPVWMGMTISQNVSLVLLFCAIALWINILLKPPGTALATYRAEPAQG